MKIENYKRAEQILSTISKLDDLKDCIDKFDDADWSFNYKAVFNSNFSEIATDKEFVSRFKDFIEKEKQMILSEHSPLRELEFDIKMYGIPYWVSNHFVRHVHAQPFVSTSRPDITGSKVSRHDMRQDDLVNLQLSLNAQEIINISKLRLCNKASEETREVWYKVLDEVARIEPLLASACVPQCVYRGFCPEPKSCGRDKISMFPIIRKFYKNLETYQSNQ